MNSYLTQAQELFLLAKKELNNAKLLNDENLARDASGKAWISATDAMNYLKKFIHQCENGKTN